MSDFEPPPLIQNRYRISERLGKGSMGVVYHAFDETLNRDVAIKFLTAPQLGDTQASQRFLREARVIARLSHAHIMSIYDIGQEGASLYLVLEYIPGTDLYGWMQYHPASMSLGQALEIVAAVLRALAYAHARDLIHRDLKPENIMITPEGEAKVTDFGLAFAAGETRLTAEDAVVGTIHYMAPELLMGRHATPQSDLYALGAVLYEMLAGQPPYQGDSTATLMANILNNPLTPITLINPDTPPEIETLLSGLLHKDPSQRYGSADQVLGLLPDLDEARRLVDESARRSAQEQLAQSLLERIVRSSSDAHKLNLDDGESLGEAPEPLAQRLLIYAAQEDLIEAIEAERRSMAHDLQASVISQLNLLLAQMNAYEQTLGVSSPQTQMVLSILSSLTRQTLQQARDLEERLHPTSLQTLGLEPALEALASQERRSRGVDVVLALQRLRERLAPPVELALYRAAQSAIDRAIRESRASRVAIRLERHDDSVHFTISDDGLLPAGDVLRSTRQRIEAIDGHTELRRGAWGGLEFTISFPVVPPVELTERERDVIQLVAEGLTNKEIAALLYVAPRTVKFHLDNIFSKLGVNTRTEAAIQALHRGWVRRREPETA